MSHLKLSSLAAAVCFFVWRDSNAVAQDATLSPEATNFLPMRVTLRDEAIIGWQQVHRAYVAVGTNTIAFCVPDKFHVDASDPSKVVLVQDDFNCYLTVQILPPAAPDRLSQPEFFRGLLEGRYPGANIVSEFALSAGSCNGPAYDVQWTNSSRIPQSARALFVPTNVGIVELTLLSKSEKFSESRRFFDSFRFSYCTDQGGPIKPILAPKEPPRT